MEYTKLHGPDGQPIFVNGGSNGFSFSSLEKQRPFSVANSEKNPTNYLNNNTNNKQSIDQNNIKYKASQNQYKFADKSEHSAEYKVLYSKPQIPEKQKGLSQPKYAFKPTEDSQNTEKLKKFKSNINNMNNMNNIQEKPKKEIIHYNYPNEISEDVRQSDNIGSKEKKNININGYKNRNKPSNDAMKNKGKNYSNNSNFSNPQTNTRINEINQQTDEHSKNEISTHKLSKAPNDTLVSANPIITEAAFAMNPSKEIPNFQESGFNNNFQVSMSEKRAKKSNGIIPSMPKGLSEFLKTYETKEKVKTFVNNFMVDPIVASEKKNDEILHSVNRYKGMFGELKKQNVIYQNKKEPKAITSDDIKNKILVKDYDEKVRITNKEKIEKQKKHPKLVISINKNRPKSEPKPPKIHKVGEEDNGSEILHLLGKIEEESKSEDEKEKGFEKEKEKENRNESKKKSFSLSYIKKEKKTKEKKEKKGKKEAMEGNKESKKLILKPVKEITEEQKAKIKAYMVEKQKRDNEKMNREKKLKLFEQLKKGNNLKQLDEQIQNQFKDKDKDQSKKQSIKRIQQRSTREMKKAKSIDEKIDPVLINNLIEELNQIEPKEDFRTQAPKLAEKGKTVKTNNLDAIPYPEKIIDIQTIPQKKKKQIAKATKEKARQIREMQALKGHIVVNNSGISSPETLNMQIAAAFPINKDKSDSNIPNISLNKIIPPVNNAQLLSVISYPNDTKQLSPEQNTISIKEKFNNISYKFKQLAKTRQEINVASSKYEKFPQTNYKPIFVQSHEDKFISENIPGITNLNKHAEKSRTILDDENSGAAIRIQKTFRGYIVRKKLKNRKYEKKYIHTLLKEESVKENIMGDISNYHSIHSISALPTSIYNDSVIPTYDPYNAVDILINEIPFEYKLESSEKKKELNKSRSKSKAILSKNEKSFKEESIHEEIEEELPNTDTLKADQNMSSSKKVSTKELKSKEQEIIKKSRDREVTDDFNPRNNLSENPNRMIPDKFDVLSLQENLVKLNELQMKSILEEQKKMQNNYSENLKSITEHFINQLSDKMNLNAITQANLNSNINFNIPYDQINKRSPQISINQNLEFRKSKNDDLNKKYQNDNLKDLNNENYNSLNLNFNNPFLSRCEKKINEIIDMRRNAIDEIWHIEQASIDGQYSSGKLSTFSFEKKLTEINDWKRIEMQEVDANYNALVEGIKSLTYELEKARLSRINEGKTTEINYLDEEENIQKNINIQVEINEIPMKLLSCEEYQLSKCQLNSLKQTIEESLEYLNKKKRINELNISSRQLFEYKQRAINEGIRKNMLTSEETEARRKLEEAINLNVDLEIQKVSKEAKIEEKAKPETIKFSPHKKKIDEKEQKEIKDKEIKEKSETRQKNILIEKDKEIKIEKKSPIKVEEGTKIKADESGSIPEEIISSNNDLNDSKGNKKAIDSAESSNQNKLVNKQDDNSIEDSGRRPITEMSLTLDKEVKDSDSNIDWVTNIESMAGESKKNLLFGKDKGLKEISEQNDEETSNPKNSPPQSLKGKSRDELISEEYKEDFEEESIAKSNSDNNLKESLSKSEELKKSERENNDEQKEFFKKHLIDIEKDNSEEIPEGGKRNEEEVIGEKSNINIKAPSNLKNLSENEIENLVEEAFHSVMSEVKKNEFFPKRGVEFSFTSLFGSDSMADNKIKNFPSGIHTTLDAVFEYVEEVFNFIRDNPENFFKRLYLPLNRDPLFVLGQLQTEPEDYFKDLDQDLVQTVLPIEIYLEIEKNRKEKTDNKRLNESSSLIEKNHQVTEWSNIHNKCIFDVINDALDYFRPYNIKGIPLPWSTQRRELTFRNAKIDTLEPLLAKVKDKVNEWCSIQAGILKLPTNIAQNNNGKQEENQIVETSETLLNKAREEKLTMLLSKEIIETENIWADYELEEVQIKVEIADLILSDLTIECIHLINEMKSNMDNYNDNYEE